MYPGRVHIVCMGRADLLRLVVHHGDKRFNAPGNLYSQDIRRVVRVADEHRGEKLTRRQNLVAPYLYMVSLPLRERFARRCDLTVKIGAELLHDDYRGHELHG